MEVEAGTDAIVTPISGAFSGSREMVLAVRLCGEIRQATQSRGSRVLAGVFVEALCSFGQITTPSSPRMICQIDP